MPKVTVCIAQYNRVDKLILVIEDLLNQSYRDFELLICDDASTEDTGATIAQFKDPRIRYIRNTSNLGLYPNFNRCIELATGDYIAIYHNHDRYAADIVERSVKVLDAFPQVGYVHTGTMTRPVGSHYDINHVLPWPEVVNGRWFVERIVHRWDSPVHQPTVMARRAIYRQVGPYDDISYGACADIPIWIKMSMIADVGYVPLPLMRVEPRISVDRYGEFEWKNVIGTAWAHDLGIRLLHDNGDPAKLAYELTKMKRRNDRYFLIMFLRCIAKGRFDLLQEGLAAIKGQCTPGAYFIGRMLSATSRWLQLPLYVPAKGYGVLAKTNSRIYSVRGWMLTRKRDKAREWKDI